MKRFVPLAVSVVLCTTLFAANDAQQLLESHFQNKTFFIRGFYRDNKLIYDAHGNVQGTPRAGPWTLALVHVDRVHVGHGEFVLNGKRAAEAYDADKKQFVSTLPQKAEDVRITVEAASDNVSDAMLDALTQRIFETRVSEDEVPDYWRPFFAVSSRDQQSEFGTEAEQMERRETTMLNTMLGVDSFSRPGIGGVTAPRVIFRTDPKYEELARQARFQGTAVLGMIVNKEGVPQKLHIVKPLGMGLDERAVEAVSNWRFSPSMLNGQPVSVAIKVEVAFRLF